MLTRWREEAVAFALTQFHGEFDHVVARIAAVRDGNVAAELLLVARVQRLGEDVGLRTRVVHIIFALDLVPGRRQRRRERVADGRPAPVADVQRAGRVGRDELDLRSLAPPESAVRESRSLLDDAVHFTLHEPLGEAQVDEARRRDAGRVDDLARGKVRGDCRGDGQRGHHRRACELQRQGAGVVAVGRVAGPLDHSIGQGHVGQASRFDGRPCRPGDKRAHAVAEGGRLSHRPSVSPPAQPREWLSGGGRAPHPQGTFPSSAGRGRRGRVRCPRPRRCPRGVRYAPPQA